MFLVFMLVLLNAVAVSIVDRIAWLKKHPVVIGVLFGLIAGLAHVFRMGQQNPEQFFSLVDVPILAAGFFFGTVPGLTAGIAAALLLTATYLWNGIGIWFVPVALTLVVAYYGVVTSKYYFYGNRPSIVPFTLCMIFGEFLRVLLFFLYLGIFAASDALWNKTFVSLIPSLSVSAASGILIAVCNRQWGNWHTNLLNKTMLSFILNDFACVLIIFGSVYFAAQNTEQVLKAGFHSLRESFLAQMQYMMRNTADFYDRILLKKYPPEQERDLLRILEFDRSDVYDRNGKLVWSTDPEVMKSGKQLDFQPLEEGSLRKTSIMETMKSEGGATIFRIAVPRSDGEGYISFTMNEKSMGKKYEVVVIPLLKQRSFSDSGFYVFTTPDGKIPIPVYNRPKLLDENIRSLGITEKHLAEEDQKMFFLNFNGQYCACLKNRSPFTGDVTFLFLPVRETFAPYLSLGCIACLVLVLFLYFFQIMLTHLHQAWKKIDNVQREKLSMVQKDMEIARHVQMDDLRNDSPEEKNIRIESFIKPVEAVGGDFYDYFQLKNGLMVHVIGDVAGEGIPAALFMMKAKTSIRENMRTSATLSEALTNVNEHLCRNNSSLMFVTLWIGVLHTSTGVGEYICAGHHSPLWVHPDGTSEWLENTDSMALGVSFRTKFASKCIKLKRNDRIFLYTDGVIEAKSRYGEQFSADRMKKILDEGEDNHIEKVYEAVRKFTVGHTQSDDITMLEVEYLGSDAEPVSAVSTHLVPELRTAAGQPV